jgi:protein-disulfide isomerase
VYRHYPLASIHPEAVQKAEAAECAGEQGKFWEYSDLLFSSQPESRSPNLLVDLSSRLGLDKSTFTKCLSSGKYEKRVSGNIEDAQARRILATPTFFVNGKRHEGVVSYEQLSQLINNQKESN